MKIKTQMTKVTAVPVSTKIKFIKVAEIEASRSAAGKTATQVFIELIEREYEKQYGEGGRTT